jgi:hypothetical protein
MDQVRKEREGLEDVVGDLLMAYRNLATIKVVEHTSLGASVGIVGIASLVIAMFALLFAGFGFAWWLGEHLQNMKAGFFIVGGIYLVFLIVVVATYKKFLLPTIRNRIIKKIYEKD